MEEIKLKCILNDEQIQCFKCAKDIQGKASKCLSNKCDKKLCENCISINNFCSECFLIIKAIIEDQNIVNNEIDLFKDTKENVVENGISYNKEQNSNLDDLEDIIKDKNSKNENVQLFQKLFLLIKNIEVKLNDKIEINKLEFTTKIDKINFDFKELKDRIESKYKEIHNYKEETSFNKHIKNLDKFEETLNFNTLAINDLTNNFNSKIVTISNSIYEIENKIKLNNSTSTSPTKLHNQAPGPLGSSGSLTIFGINDLSSKTISLLDEKNILDKNKSKLENSNLYDSSKKLSFNETVTTFLHFEESHKTNFCDVVIVGSNKGSIVVYSITDGKLIKSYNPHKKAVNSFINFSYYKEGYFISGSEDKSMKIMDISKKETIMTINHLYSIKNISALNVFTKNSFATGDNNGYLTLYIIKDDNNIKEKKLKELSSSIYCLRHINTVSPFNLIIASHENGNLINWDLIKLKVNFFYNKEHSGNVEVELYKESMFISCSKNDHEIRIWNYDSPKSVFVFNKFESSPLSICLDGDILLCSFKDKSAKSFDLNLRKEKTFGVLANEAKLISKLTNCKYQFVCIIGPDFKDMLFSENFI